jgi:hypothetical protein
VDSSISDCASIILIDKQVIATEQPHVAFGDYDTMDRSKPVLFGLSLLGGG